MSATFGHEPVSFGGSLVCARCKQTAAQTWIDEYDNPRRRTWSEPVPWPCTSAIVLGLVPRPPHTTGDTMPNYLAAAVAAFQRANLTPTEWEDTEDGGHLTWNTAHPALDTWSSWPAGASLTWGEEGWHLVDLDGHNAMPLRADVWVDPEALARLVEPALRDGEEPADGWGLPRWEHAPSGGGAA
ncbi:hypothetical protein [Streptomyces macrosporus]|uniref:Uncharacterized protein n=1 Tax=Streptomyces macrosporus TaxID=44032 RepID=A0ABN3KHK7_9ACTN